MPKRKRKVSNTIYMFVIYMLNVKITNFLNVIYLNDIILNVNVSELCVHYI